MAEMNHRTYHSYVESGKMPHDMIDLFIDYGNNMNREIRLLVTCVDRPGIVASITNFLYWHGANIITLDQYSTDPENGMFFMRLVFDALHVKDPIETLHQRFKHGIAENFAMNFHFSEVHKLKRMAILVSKYDHVLLELLWLWKQNKLQADLVQVISNHPDLCRVVESYQVPYVHVPVTPDTKKEAEQKILELLEGKTDFVVLARYMQILGEEFVARYSNQIINIHHSFLPAFIGANPYKQACERGVKIIGATAHYVTAELDAGPIIEQDVIRVSHKCSARDMQDLGRELERAVLARAVKWHIEDRILVHGNKTIVFV